MYVCVCPALSRVGKQKNQLTEREKGLRDMNYFSGVELDKSVGLYCIPWRKTPITIAPAIIYPTLVNEGSSLDRCQSGSYYHWFRHKIPE